MPISKIKTRHNGVRSGSKLAALGLVMALIASGWLLHFIPGVTASGYVATTGEPVSLPTAERQTPYLILSGNPTTVPTEYTTGTGHKELAGGTMAHALASADFDEDGVPDLLGGYTGSSGVGVITLQRGNVDAIYPNSAEARERQVRGEFTDSPFHSAAGAFIVPDAADFVGAGDFDANGHLDVVTARRGGNALYFLRGDGRGNLARAERIQLPGALTALVTGEMNRRDGLTDIVVGITSEAGAAALVFESPSGALRAQPETLALPTTATDLVLGALDADPSVNDLAIAAGNELLIVHGRDRRLSVDEAGDAAVPGPSVSRNVFESAVASITIGDFADDTQQELAVLTADGNVRVLTHQSDTKKNTSGVRAGANAFRSSETMTLALDIAEAGTSPRQLLAANVSALSKDDLLVFGGTNEVQIVTTRDPDVFDESGKLATTGSERLSVSASLTSQSEVEAVIPMRLNADALEDLVIATKNANAPSVVQTQPAATFVVNIDGNTNDKAPGNGVCADAADKCSFNAALQEANAHPGADTINFNIPGGGVHTVTHFFQEYFNEAVTIDGTTQPDGRIEIAANGDYPVVFFGGNSVLRGVATYGTFAAIVLVSNANIVEGNYVGFRSDGSLPVGFGPSGSGIIFRGGNSGSLRGDNNFIGGTTAQARNVISNCSQALNLADSVGNVFRGNYIGTNVAGTAALSNAIAFLSSGGGFTIGGTTSGAGNLISGNGSTATLSIQASTAIIQGNLIGTTADGTQPLANNGIGIEVNSIGKVVTIGGTTPAARNVIAANSTGILIRQDDTPGSNELVQGNFIGTNAAGTGALPNLASGIFTGGATHVTIGGAVNGAGNLISGNGEDGISVAGGINGIPSTAVIQGNLIGTDVNGVVAIPNIGNGIQLPSSNGTIIGGTSPAARNVISGNHANGIRGGFGTASNQITGNYIGLNRFGTGALGNTGDGIFFDNFSSGNTIGGTASGASNNIAFNGGAGVGTASGVPILSAVVANSIHDNAGLGIDLSDNGVTKNTLGSNSNYPVITSVQSSNTNTTIQGTLQNGNFTAGITYTLQFFSNTNVDPSGYGEGQTYIGQTTLITDGTTAPHPFSLTVTPAVPPGRFITAIAFGKDQFNEAKFEYLSEFSFAAKVTGNTTPQNTPLRINAVTPMVGGDNGGSTLTIIGEGISQNATVRLRRPGQNDIVGASIVVSTDGSSLIARFNLTGKAQGAWDIVVTNADGTTAILPGAYMIEAGRAPEIWADLLGRTAIRRSQAVRYTVVCGNRGNADAYGVPLFVTGIPKGARVTLGFDLLPVPLTGPGLPNFSPSEIPAVIQTATDQMIPLIIPVIPVNTVRSLTFTLEVPATQSNFSLKVFATNPLLEVVDSSAQNSPRQVFDANANGERPIQLELSQNGQDCLKSLLTNGASCAANFVPGTDCAKTAINVASLSATVGLTISSPPNDYLHGVLALGQVISGGLSTVWSGFKCFADATPAGPVLDIVSCVLAGASTIVDCAPAGGELLIKIVTSIDPNDKIGANGGGNEHYTTGALPLRYVVYFENKPEATAPAQNVVITDQLDTTKLDLGTFQLGPISFSNKVLNPPSGLSDWTTDVDLRPANNLVVRIIAALEKTNGIVTWRFSSLDPVTMQPTDNPTAGFLPPNTTAPQGDGAVAYTINAKPNQPNGTEIRNKARIFFDQNAPIDTPEWLNTIDNSLPTSHVLPLASNQSSIVFNVSWTGQDTGSGIRTFDGYVSENGGSFTKWLGNTSATSALFIGLPGKSYRFYSIARDGAGNFESAKTLSEALTSTPSAVVNSIDEPRYFVWRHYRDFLSRDPDQSGLDFWTDQITGCGNDAQCAEVKRINVSAAFFLSIEFQETGYLAYLTYKESYGNLPGGPVPLRFSELQLDSQEISNGVIVGQAGWEQLLESNKHAFMLDFVQRSRFTSAFQTAMTPAAFVDKLYLNAGVTPSALDRTAAVNEFGVASTTSDVTARARVLRRVTDNSAFRQQEFNKVFVLMQYYGYLRRNPNDAPDSDFSGYNFWLNKLNQFGGNFVNAEMVKAFIVSGEYRQRFAP